MKLLRRVWMLTMLLLPLGISLGFSPSKPVEACEYGSYNESGACGCMSTCGGFDWCYQISSNVCLVSPDMCWEDCN